MRTLAKVLGCCLLAMSLGTDCHGQTTDSAVKQVRFAQRPAQVHDRVIQTLDVQLALDSTITHSGQIAHQSTSTLHRKQERMIEVEEVAKGHVRSARVAFRTCRQQSPENEDPQQFVADPVEGKVYRVLRNGKQLTVTDSDGAIPPQDEYTLVVNSVQTLGLPNPLTAFLVGKTVTVGERLQLPKQIAEKMLGIGNQAADDPLGSIESFELELTQIQEIDGLQCAVFAATILARGEVAGKMQLQATGKVVIEAATSRALSAELQGPLSLTIDQSTRSDAIQYTAQGNMRVAVQSQYVGVVK